MPAEAKEGRSRRRKILAMATYKARIPSCFLLLVMAFALVAFQGFHKIRDERLSNDIISEKNAEIERLREELQKERITLDEVRGKLKELHKYTDMLRSEKVKLTNQLNELEIVKNVIEERQLRLQSFLQNKEDQINQLKKQEREVIENKAEVQALTGLLDKKENEIKEIKAHLAQFEEGTGKDQNNMSEKMEAHNSNDVQISELVISTGNVSAEKQDMIEATKEKSNMSKEETKENEFSEIRAMENVERDALEDKVGTTSQNGGLHDRQLEERTELQNIRTRNQDEDEKDSTEEENEGVGDNFDDMKEAENLEMDTDDKDLEDEQGEDIDKVNDEEEADN